MVSDIQPALFGRFLWKSPKIFYWAILYMLFQAETLEQPLPTPLPAISSTSITFSLLFRARKLVADLKIWSWFFALTLTSNSYVIFSPYIFLEQSKQIFLSDILFMCVLVLKERTLC